MYYLLGHRLVGQNLDARRKQNIADNTYILTLDGDVDFKPSAVQLLVDRMKKNEKVGAACGRIHPIGMGKAVYHSYFAIKGGKMIQTFSKVHRVSMQSFVLLVCFNN